MPSEEDPLEKENRHLKERLSVLENRLPKIVVGFSGEELPNHATFQVEPPGNIQEDVIARTVNSKKKALLRRFKLEPKPPKSTGGLHDNSIYLSAIQSFGALNESEIMRCKTDIARYLVESENYLRDCWEFNARKKRSIVIDLEIRNVGNLPAEDVDVHVHFPDGFSLYEEDCGPEHPKKPQEPVGPRSFPEIMNTSIINPGFYERRSIPQVSTTATNFSIRRSNSYDVRDAFSRIKHGMTVHIPKLLLVFDSFEDAKSFDCDYSISAANIPKIITGKLHFIINK